MANELQGRRIAIVAVEGVEQVELVEPRKAVEEAGADTELLSPDVVRGRTLTSYPSVRTDIRNAGGKVVDQEVVTDQALVSSRKPDDLPAFNRTIVEVFATATPRPAFS